MRNNALKLPFLHWIINAYNVYERKKTLFINNQKDLRDWCKNNYLDYCQLLKVTQLKDDIEKRLAEFCIITNIREFINDDRKKSLVQSIETQSDDSDKYIKQTSKNDYILKFILAGAFYPNYFLLDNAREDHAIRSLQGHDPRKCVYLRGDRLSVLYNEKLLDILKYTCESDINTIYVDNK
jgi:ATP-dependent RNA helicase TDRD9